MTPDSFLIVIVLLLVLGLYLKEAWSNPSDRVLFLNSEGIRIYAMQIKDNASQKYKIALKDVKGNIVSVSKAPSWAVADENLALVQASDDGMSAVVSAVGPLGSTKVQVSGVNDDGSAFSGETDLEVIGSDAVTVEISPVDEA